MAGRLDDQVALVTGGARGQGEAIVRRFVDEGARVVITDVLVAEGERLAKELGASTTFQEMDISAPEAWESAIAATEKCFGPVDVLVNNAAITQMGPLEQVTLEEHDRVFAVNQRGVFLGMLAVMPAMKERGAGVIINTTTAATIQGIIGQSIYTASKAAVLAMTKIAAAEWGPYGIRVNSILPGPIDTPMMRGPHTVDVDFGAFFRSQPIQRAGQPDEIAKVAVFLASDDSSYVTGVALPVDGGRSAARPVPRS